jgi:tRNA modification GTPase
MLDGSHDTIAAVSTPAGRGAIGIVRISGPRAHEIASKCLSRWPEQARFAQLAEVRDPSTDSLVDRAVVTRYDGPNSFTGEDLVEISGHGGVLSPAAVCALLIREGARPAEPGEFTRRALLNGKVDLLQAEAIASTIDARTEAARRGSLHQIDGGVSRQIGTLRDALLELEALVAYDIDFPEEDDGPIRPERVDNAVNELRRRIDALLASVRLGEIVREGAVVVLAGLPNTGKSSLFNALLGIERAIVHETPGTTRDAIDAVIEAGRWPLRLVDTAGLRSADDVIEQTGVEISRRYIAGAHLVLVCGSTVAELDAAMRAVESHTTAPRLGVMTKSDQWGSPVDPGDVFEWQVVSSRDRTGLSELVVAIEQALDREYGALDPDLPLLTRSRHQAALQDASRELDAFTEQLRIRAVPVSIATVHLRTAVHALETLVGAVDVEDVLSRVFSSFCVGK